MKGGVYAKILAKIQLSVIFHKRDIKIGDMFYQNL